MKITAPCGKTHHTPSLPFDPSTVLDHIRHCHDCEKIIIGRYGGLHSKHIFEMNANTTHYWDYAEEKTDCGIHIALTNSGWITTFQPINCQACLEKWRERTLRELGFG